MGLFSFVKEIGNKLFGGPAEAATSDALQKQVQEGGLDAGGLTIDVKDGKVKVSGKAKSTEEAEKIILALGNSIGISEVETGGLIVEKEAAASEMYTVKKGDTLWKIAEKHYGKGDKYPLIVKANTPPIKNPDLIQPGWVLRLPPADQLG